MSKIRNPRRFVIGETVGLWEIVGDGILKYSGNSQYTYHSCRCKCGTVRDVLAKSLAAEASLNCGCDRYANTAKRLTTHGGSHSPIYGLWKSIRERCKNPKKKSYKYYGGRGIHVCQDWDINYKNFQIWVLSHGYCEDLEIDRIDTDGNYQPGNCRFATRIQNCNNMRKSKYLTAFGVTKSESEWVRDPRCVVSQMGLRDRLRRGMAPEKAISTPTDPRYRKNIDS